MENKFIKNPLTVIGVFSGIAEVSMTIAISFFDTDQRNIFIWFIIGFPIMLVLLFFITLIFRAEVLYAPSDFKNEENFLKTLKLKRSKKRK